MQMQISNDDIELSLLPTITLTLAEIVLSSLSVGMRSSLGHSTVLFGMAPYVSSLALFNDGQMKPHMTHNGWKIRYVPILSTTLHSSFSYLSKVKL
jgi:hypothetical protein